MAKRATVAPQTPPAAPAKSQPSPPMIDVNGPAEATSIVQSRIVPSEFTLSDGTVLTVTPVLTNASRLTGQFNAEGDPVYRITTGFVVGTRAPPGLRKRAATAKPGKRKSGGAK